MHLSHAIVSGALLASASARIPKFWNLQGNKELYAHNQLKVRQAPLPAGCSRNSINSLLNGNDGSTDFCRAFLNGDNVVTETNFLGGGTQTIETVVIISDLPVSYVPRSGRW